ncbi:MAG: hypothetical protein KAR05_10255 [Candidatus Omnitrophica bacterium]|nr:hypothetical protein [Candidatus Omnitrophota bacterium]
MGFFEKLLEILSNLKELKNVLPPLNFSLINITKNDNSITTNDDSTKNLSVSYKEIQNRADELLPLALDEGYTFLQRDAQELMEDFKEKEKESEIKEAVSFLRGKIPDFDINIWRAALYLRAQFKLGNKEKTNFLKRQIMEKYGDKGRNIANLCSANYLEDFLIPLFNALKENDKNDVFNDKFLKVYSKVVDDLPFIIFVNHSMGEEEIKRQIQIKRNYGIKALNLHGIGRENIAKIKKVLSFVEENSDCPIKKEIREGNEVIFAAIRYESKESI